MYSRMRCTDIHCSGPTAIVILSRMHAQASQLQEKEVDVTATACSAYRDGSGYNGGHGAEIPRPRALAAPLVLGTTDSREARHSKHRHGIFLGVRRLMLRHS